MAGWRAEVLSRVDSLSSMLAASQVADKAALTNRLGNVKGRASGLRPEPLVLALSGGSSSICWAELHHVEESINAAETTVSVLKARMDDHLDREFPPAAARAKREEYAALGADDERKRLACETIALAHRAAQGLHDREDDLRRLLRSVSGAMILVAAGMVVLSGAAVEILPKPESVGSRTVFLIAVLVFGALGGLLSFVLGLATAELPQSQWFDPRRSLAAVKVSAGPILAVLGLLLASSGAVVVEYETMPQALALAVVFGFSQQTVGRAAEKYAVRKLKLSDPRS